MSKGRFLLGSHIRTAQEELEEQQEALAKKAAKKSLWGSWGRTLGGLAAMALTGGAATPLAAGLMAAGGSAIGGAVGSAQQNMESVKIKGTGKSSRFFKEARSDLKESRSDLQKDLGGLGAENLMQSAMSGITTGIAQGATNLTAAGKEAVAARKAAGRGALDFGTSALGKGLQSGKNLFEQFISANTLENPEQLRGMTGMSKLDYLNLIMNRQKEFNKDNPGFNNGDNW